MKILVKGLLVLSIFFIAHTGAMAAETPIGLPHTIGGMDIAAVYLQPIEMEPSTGHHAMRTRKDSDIHIEADIAAAEGNTNGFGAGEWVPYLSIDYTLIKLDTKEKIEGKMMPMVANDGPHYGDNVKMLGVGKYRLIVKVDNPLKTGFGRHTDRETGVGSWFEPFEVEWEFNFFGAGKKGGY